MNSRHRLAAAARLAAAVLALVAGQTVLWHAGRALPPMPLDGTSLLRTLDEADPMALAVGLVRIVALVVGAGLLVTTVLGVVARGCGAARVVARLDRCTPPSLRRVLDGAMGVGLAATIGLSGAPASADPGAAPVALPTLRRLPDVPPTTLVRLPDARPPAIGERSPPPGPPEAAAVTLRRLDGIPPPTSAPESAPAPTTPASPAAPSTAASASGTDRREVVVQPGDSFWRLAERHEADRLGRRPSEAEVGACWQQMVATNRHRLAVPGDADLLFPGQVLLLP